MRYLSICSGIEAASVAWDRWSPFAFAEIDRFPSIVLSHHYGSNLPNEKWSHNAPPNLGDIRNFGEWPDAAIDVLVGGTPCQSFSVAGLRGGLADPRGNLCLTFLAIADKYRPEWLLWENVPGVLSSNGGRDFGAFLGGLGQLGYGWAYRVLDAQYVRVDGFARAVPQRRRRVFVVGHLGDWRRAAAVLFERESLQGHPAPRRQAGQGAAPTLAARTRGGGGLGTDFDCDGGLVAAADLRNMALADVAQTMQSSGKAEMGLSVNALPHVVTSHDVSRSLLAKGNDSFDDSLQSYVVHALRAEGFDASEDGTGRGTPLIAFSSKDYGGDAVSGIAPTLRAMEFDHSHANAGGQLAVAFQCEGTNISADEQVAGTLRKGNGHLTCGGPAVAFDMRGREGGSQFEGPHETANIRAASGGSSRSYVAESWAVRHLTPLECERLQGFPDGYTLVPDRGRMAADGPRYKALGNSMAVNAMRWLGRRIEMVHALAKNAA